MAHERLGLFDTPPGPREIRLAFVLVGLLFAAYLLILPVKDIRLGEMLAFVPVIDSVVFVGELIIAALLFAQAAVFRSRALRLLASGFVFIALLLLAHALTFPGAFAPDGLFGAGSNSTAWIMIFRRLGFPVAVILYALLTTADLGAETQANQPPLSGFASASCAVVLAVALTVLAIQGNDLLPPIFSNRSDAILSNLTIFNVSNIVVILAAMIVLFVKRRSMLDLWLQVALTGWLIQSALNLSIGSRFTIGWYCLFLIVLSSHLFVLLAMIGESNRLHSRLALSTAARDRERDARMMSMEAVAAAIAHEIGQPLTAITLNASAGLTSLTRTQPDPESAIRSLRDTIDAGHRAFDVLKSIRGTVTNRSGSWSEFSLNDLARETASLLAREVAARNVSLEVALDEALPLIRGNRVQIQRVLINLLTNAVDAVSEPGARARSISIRSKTTENGEVLLEVSDTGGGIAPDKLAHIFDPFFTTKATGTGLGLSLSRTILEEHHGRLWASPGDGCGAVFHLQLPCAAAHATHH